MSTRTITPTHKTLVNTSKSSDEKSRSDKRLFGKSLFSKKKIKRDDDIRKGKIVVIGNGMVSHRFCKEMVALAESTGSSYEITVLGEEKSPAYDRVHLSDYVKHRKPEELFLDDENWYTDNAIKLHLGGKVTQIDRENKKVITESSKELFYDKLVLATGSTPFLPPIKGIQSENVFVYRTINDLEKIIQFCQGKKKGVIIGGGLLGLEASQAIKQLGMETTVVEIAYHLMPQQLDEGSAAILKKKVESQGINVMLGLKTKLIEQANGHPRLLFDGDQLDHLDTEVVIVSAGIRPRGELAIEAELETIGGGGIKVDDKLCTSDEAIFAIGECASHRGSIYGLVGPGYEMASILAHNFHGQEKKFIKPDTSTRLKMLGVDVVSFGEPLQPEKQVVFSEEEKYRKIVLKRGKIIGALAIGEWSESSKIQHYTSKERKIPKKEISYFLDHGQLKKESPPITHTWPEHALVCNCMKVSKGDLANCIAKGVNDVEHLVKETGASTVCGSCKPLLYEFFEEAPPENTHGNKLLGIFSSLAIVFSIGIFFKDPLPFSETVQDVWHRIDVLWRNGAIKQFTGYLLLVLTLVGGLFPLFKRMKFKMGDFNFWRKFHVALGVFSLLALVGHTGFDMGKNFNSILFLIFISLNLLGGLAGAAGVLEDPKSGKISALFRRMRPSLNWLHLILVWPLPAFLIIHILSIYFY